MEVNLDSVDVEGRPSDTRPIRSVSAAGTGWPVQHSTRAAPSPTTPTSGL